MRSNLPVTDQEHIVPPGMSIVSKTDLLGIITYANDAFVQISGYQRDELIGQPHNMLRHPDMPPQAFAHMWKTLEKGNPWKGIVKNRTKDGGFYWVKAVVVPIRKDDKTIGYMSVRECATREEIAQAEAAYKKLWATGASIADNVLHGLMTIRTGFFLGSLFVIFLMIAGGFLGIGGLMLSNSTVDTIHRQHIAPLGVLSELKQVTQQVRMELLAPASDKRVNLQTASQASIKMGELLKTLKAMPLDPDAVGLRDAVVNHHINWQERLIAAQNKALSAPAEPSDEPAGAEEPAPRDDMITALLMDEFTALTARIQSLENGIHEASARNQKEMLERNELIWKIALSGLITGILVVIIVGRFFLRDIVTPLQTAIGNFDRIAQGDLSGDVEVFGKGETGQLIRASAVMQMHLKVITDEIYLVARGIQEHCSELNSALFEIADHSEIQHDRLNQARNVLSDSQTFSRELEGMVAELRALCTLCETGEASSPLQEAATLVERIENAIRLQSFAFEDFLNRIEQIAELVVDNRQDTQAAYAMSAHLQRASDNLYQLVAYFSTSGRGYGDTPEKP